MSRVFASRARYLGRLASARPAKPHVPIKEAVLGLADTQSLPAVLRRCQRTSSDWETDLCEARDAARAAGKTRLQAHLQAEINRLYP